MDKDGEKYRRYSAADVARIFGVSHQTLYAMIHGGMVPYRCFGDPEHKGKRSRYFFFDEDIEEIARIIRHTPKEAQ